MFATKNEEEQIGVQKRKEKKTSLDMSDLFCVSSCCWSLPQLCAFMALKITFHSSRVIYNVFFALDVIVCVVAVAMLFRMRFLCCDKCLNVMSEFDLLPIMWDAIIVCLSVGLQAKKII